jgi:crotonobetainyl-CoA:carnitine CoA-transferase CaiB-like acyl-CoA transferase
LASLGADVVKVESITKPDLMRLSSTRPPSEPGWWEWGPIFHAVNSSKRGITLDLSRSEGVGVFERLVAKADMVVENFTPRVMENFGLGWERLREVNPRLVMVRMPAFGLDGPWRDRTGFAQTMESISGMAWTTGRPDGPPVLPRGVCDPIAGLHAAFAGIAALRLARSEGRGRLVEVTMVEAALNVTAEQVIVWDTEGRILGRSGDGAGDCCPEGVYRCAGEDAWLALSVPTDAQWEALCRILDIDSPGEWATTAGRKDAGKEIDQLISAWTAQGEPGLVVDRLLEAGIPAAEVISSRDIASNPQLRHRGLFERETHPVTGSHELPTMPFRMSSVASWMTRPAPTLGQHNDEVLGEVANESERAALRSLGVIGETLAG